MKCIAIGSGLSEAFDRGPVREDDPIFLHAGFGIDGGLFPVEGFGRDRDFNNQAGRCGMLAEKLPGTTRYHGNVGFWSVMAVDGNAMAARGKFNGS